MKKSLIFILLLLTLLLSGCGSHNMNFPFFGGNEFIPHCQNLCSEKEMIFEPYESIEYENTITCACVSAPILKSETKK